MSQYKKGGQSYFRSKGYFFAKKKAVEKELTLVIQLIDEENVLISGPIVILKQELSALGGTFSIEEKGWVFPLKKLEALKNVASKKNSNLKFYDMPKFVNKLLESFPRTIEYKTSNKENVHITYHPKEERKRISDLPEIFQKKLYNFQKEGVAFGIQNCGRVLIADEMGVGKTAQALALASLYRNEWPFIVFVPSSLRFVWREEILTWFQGVITADEIQVIVKSNQKIQENVKALVMTYDLGAKMAEQIKNFGKFQMAIADEAYYLKNSDAKRTEQIVPILQACKRVILLAGTPVLARPKEIFNLLHILRPDILKDFKEFGKRYCAPSFNPFARGIDYSGASNLKELHYILTNSLMIRRLKKDVLSELPEKVRQKIQVETNSDHIELIKEALKKDKSGGAGGNMEKMSQILEKIVRPNWTGSGENFEEEANKVESEQELKFPQFFECYKYTGLAKLEGIKKYLKEVLQQQESKFLVFAHHSEILDALEQEVTAMGIKYIRIDGSVQTKKRFELVKSFQEDQQVKVAILSLTAAGIGLTLTEASKVIFAEMYWTPAIMLQAEDRIHRIGQKEKTSVNYYYLYGEDTLDALLYKILQKKIAVVSEMLEGEANKLRLDTDKDPENTNSQPTKKLVKKKTESEKKRIEGLEVYEYNPFERKKSSSEERSEQSLEFNKKLTDIRDQFYLEKLNSMGGDSQATVKKESVSKGPEELIRKLTKKKNKKEKEFMDLSTQNNSRKYQRNLDEEEDVRKSKNEKKQERKQVQKNSQLELNHSLNNKMDQEKRMQIEKTPSKSSKSQDSVDWDHVELMLSEEKTKNIENKSLDADFESTVRQPIDKQKPSDEFSKRLLEKCTNPKTTRMNVVLHNEKNTMKSNLDNFHYSKTQNTQNARGYVRGTQTQFSEKPPSPKKEGINHISLEYYNFKNNLFERGSSQQDYSKIYSRENSKAMEEEKQTVSNIKLNSKRITPYISKNNGIPNEVKGMRNYMRTVSDEYDDPLGFNDFKEITNNSHKEESLLTKRKLPNENDEEDSFYDLLKKMK